MHLWLRQTTNGECLPILFHTPPYSWDYMRTRESVVILSDGLLNHDVGLSVPSVGELSILPTPPPVVASVPSPGVLTPTAGASLHPLKIDSRIGTRNAQQLSLDAP